MPSKKYKVFISSVQKELAEERRAVKDFITHKAVNAFVETAEAVGRLKLKSFRSTEAVLQNYNLLREGQPTNAAMLLFGKNPERFFNNTRVHGFHFHGT